MLVATALIAAIAPCGGTSAAPATLQSAGMLARGAGYLSKLRRVMGIPFGSQGAKKALGAAVLSEGAIGLVSAESQEGNLSQTIQETQFMQGMIERVPILDNPLATKDTDSPMLKTFKNVAERMSIAGEAVGLGVAKGADDQSLVSKD